MERVLKRTRRSLGPCAVIAVLVVCSASASANLVLNGSFEDNLATTTHYNMSNAFAESIMINMTSFGTPGELDLMMNGSNTYGVPTTDGDFKMGLSVTDALGLRLSATVQAGQTYNLRFKAHAPQDFSAGTGPVLIGIGSANSFGTTIFSTGDELSTNSWDSFNATIVAPVAGNYLTVKTSGSTWAHVDMFSFTEAVPEPASLLAVGAGIAGLASSARSRRARKAAAANQ